MSRYFEGGFIQGLPELCFDIALLWQPDRPLRRRVAKQTSHSGIPSWSWVGWEGELDHNYWLNSLDRLHQGDNAKIKVTPVVATYEYEERGRRYTICISYFEYRKKYLREVNCPDHKPSEQSLPEGWSRADEAGSGLALYRHPALYKALGRSFSFPLPLHNSLAAKRPRRTGNLLYFDTTTISLIVGEVLNRRRFFGKEYSTVSVACDTDLRDSQGRWVGALRHNVVREQAPCGQTCKLVAISHGQTRQDSLGSVGLIEWFHHTGRALTELRNSG